MENWVYTFGGALGSIGAFWLVIRYVLSRLDSKVDIQVFEEFGKRIADNLDAGKRRFDKIDKGVEDSTKAISRMCGEFGKVKGTLEMLVDEIKKCK